MWSNVETSLWPKRWKLDPYIIPGTDTFNYGCASIFLLPFYFLYMCFPRQAYYFRTLCNLLAF